MKDAFGGILNLVFLAVFLLLVMGILGLIVNYTKAFRMKNIAIDTIERYEGACNTTNTACFKKMEEEAKKISYSPTITSCQTGFTNMGGLVCLKGEELDNYDIEAYPIGKPCVYTVTTQSDVSLPIIETVLSFKIFRVTGNTEVVDLPSKDGGCYVTG